MFGGFPALVRKLKRMDPRLRAFLLPPLIAVVLGCVMTGCASRVLVPTITQVGSLGIDSYHARVSLWDFGPKHQPELFIAISQKIEDPRTHVGIDSSRIRAAVILADGRRIAGEPAQSPSIMSAGWVDENHRYTLPLGVRSQLTEVVVEIDGTAHEFPISSDP